MPCSSCGRKRQNSRGITGSARPSKQVARSVSPRRTNVSVSRRGSTRNTSPGVKRSLSF